MQTSSTDPVTVPGTGIYFKETLVKGQPARLECLQMGEQTYAISRGPLTIVALEDEWFDEVRDPLLVIDELRRRTDLSPDVFTFCQRLPNPEPRYAFHYELESIAVLRVDTYDFWWNKQVVSATRNKIRKSQKAGVEVRECQFDDEFVRGMTEIFNETPVRQGRAFWHYGKDFETVKRQFSRFLFRESVIGAYHKDKMIGFAMLGDSGIFGDLGQIISKVEHRDKAPTNALIAKCVEMCAQRQRKYLVYAYWLDGPLGDFKRQSGFEEVKLPRYYVPLTAKGRLGLKLGAQRGWKAMIPDEIKAPLKKLRASWYEAQGR